MTKNSSKDFIDINKIKLYKAKASDMMDVFKLVNDPDVRKNSFNQEEIKLEDHKDWFNDKIKKNKDFLFIFKIFKEFIGHVLLTKFNDSYIISIYIIQYHRNKGLGTIILNKAIEEIKKQIISEFYLLAYVNKKNINSIKLFKKLDFKIKINVEKDKKDFLLFKKEIKEQSIIIAYSNGIYNKIFKKNNKNYYFIFDKNKLTSQILQKLKPKYIFFVHWSHIIPDYIYKNYNCIIFHMTDLPFGRGGSPLQNLISRGIYNTKISAIKCEKEIDSGKIYLKKKLSLKNGSAKDIYLKSGKIIKKMIEEICKKNIIPKTQEGEVIFFKRRTKDLSEINNLDTLKKIYDQIRMLDCDGYPNAFFNFQGFNYSFENAKFKKNTILANVKIRKL
jgi:methionyl-tRNA formyltransferase